MTLNRPVYKFFVLLLCLPVWAWSASFLPGSEDIPLMPGMITNDTPIVFDKVSGQIFTSVANTNHPPLSIFKFYDDALINLGWKKFEKGKYYRGSETLVIKVDASQKGANIVRFEFSENHTK